MPQQCKNNLISNYYVRLGLIVMALNLSIGSAAEAPLITIATRTITDLAGRQVSIPVEIRRIATAGGTPAVNSFIFAIGKGDTIVNGLPLFIKAQSKRWKYQTAFRPELAQLPALAEPPGWTPDMETLAMLHPDLSFAVDEINANLMEKRGFSTVVLNWQAPENTRKTMQLLGEVFNQQKRAAEYLQYMDSVLAKTAPVYVQVPENERPRAVYIRFDNFTQIMGSTARWIIEKAGGIPVPTKIEGPNPDNLQFSPEQLLVWNPDVLIVWSPEEIDRVYQDKRFQGIKAVQNKRVFAVPRGVHVWTHYTPEQPLAVLWAAKIFYPERLKGLDVATETQTFYRRFFNYSMSITEAQEMLNGLP